MGASRGRVVGGAGSRQHGVPPLVLPRGDPDTTASLVESLVSTIRIVILGEQLMQKDGGAEDLVTILIVASIASELRAIKDDAVKGKIITMIAESLKARRDEKAKLNAEKGRAVRGADTRALDSKIKVLDAEIEELESAAESLGIDPASLQ